MKQETAGNIELIQIGITTSRPTLTTILRRRTPRRSTIQITPLKGTSTTNKIASRIVQTNVTMNVPSGT